MLSVRSLQHCLPARVLLPMQLDKVMHDPPPPQVHVSTIPVHACLRVGVAAPTHVSPAPCGGNTDVPHSTAHRMSIAVCEGGEG